MKYEAEDVMLKIKTNLYPFIVGVEWWEQNIENDFILIFVQWRLAMYVMCLYMATIVVKKLPGYTYIHKFLHDRKTFLFVN